MVNITVAELETLFKLVIRKLKKEKIENIYLDIDEYWIVLADEWSDFSTSPSLAVGSIVDDTSYLKKAIQENEISTYSDLDRIASLLHAISELLAPTEENKNEP